MISDDIIATRGDNPNNAGEICERIILFGFHANGTPHEGNTYDFYVVLRDDSEKPILVLQMIYHNLVNRPIVLPIDIFANYRIRFEWRSTQPTIEHRVPDDVWLCMSDCKLVEKWFKYSQNDLISAKHLCEELDLKQIEVDYYLNPQCAEKAFKGHMLFEQNKSPKTCYLFVLCQRRVKIWKKE